MHGNDSDLDPGHRARDNPRPVLAQRDPLQHFQCSSLPLASEGAHTAGPAAGPSISEELEVGSPDSDSAAGADPSFQHSLHAAWN